MAKFSIIQAYKTALSVLWKHKWFYIAWDVLAACLMSVFFVLSAIYLHLVEYRAIVQNPWAIWFEAAGDASVAAVIKQRSLYAVMKFLFPYAWLNHTIEVMSWQEYYHIIVQPRLISVIFLCCAYTVMSNMISAGYIKTALALQDGRSASLLDMLYSLAHLPRIFLAHIYRAILVVTPGAVILLAEFLMPSLNLLWAVCALLYLVYVVRMVRSALMIYYVIDEAAGPQKALRASWASMRGNIFWYLLFCGANPIGLLLRLKWLAIVYKINKMIQQQASVSVYRQLKQ